MSLYYDGLPLTGSGIDDHTITAPVTCHCGYDDDHDITMRGHTGTWTCPTCDTEHEWEDDR